ncbi:MAG: prepilin-type N-terminal cleavage/methylation domain-containing protein [Planctomycetota bacterium]|nr:prepilin-type N-terminal cleavage/methylation domain-containing protein [Planctomycetota bacterium]
MNREKQSSKPTASEKRIRSAQRGFTILELLVAIAIISLFSAMITVGMSTLQRQAQIRRCEQQVKKIDELIQTRFSELINKPLPIQFPSLGTNPSPAQIAFRKFQIMTCRRELMRMELPDRITDVTNISYMFRDPTTNTQYAMMTPSSTNAFRRKATLNGSQGNAWTEDHQGSECLYLILSIMQDQDANALDFLFPSEIGDTDGDGMLEVLDAFGNPLGFLRWAPGISARPGVDGRWGTPNVDDNNDGIIDNALEFAMGNSDDYRSFSGIQGVDEGDAPDWTDIGGADYRHYDSNPSNNPFHLFPLICSAGPDDEFGMYGLGINPGTPGFRYQATMRIDPNNPSTTIPFPYDPYHFHNDTNADGYQQQYGAFIHNGMLDNITNHDIEEAP